MAQGKVWVLPVQAQLQTQVVGLGLSQATAFRRCGMARK
jgi:hypothetical protein